MSAGKKVSKAHLPPLGHGQLARLRVPGMDASVLTAIDTIEAMEAENVAALRDRYDTATERDIDPFTAADAAITPER
jgi:hypothetical protein